MGKWNKMIGGLLAAADLLLPRACIVCRRPLLMKERHLCLYCLADLPLTHFWERRHNAMADKFNEAIQRSIGKEKERYAYAAALFYFSDDASYRHILYTLKYEGKVEVGRFFGGMLGRYLRSGNGFEDVDAVIPVPLHWLRRWKRGYNQAEVVAREVAREIGADLRTDLLYRRRRTRTQTQLDIESKTANVSGAFKVKLFDNRKLQESRQEIKHILLIDDTFTTGATLHACFVALRTVFPPSVRISVATLGFVGGA